MTKFKFALVGFFLLLSACSASPVADDPRIQVVATTNIIGDIVAQVGAQDIHLTVLLPTGTDPHAYEPTSQDLRAIADADIVFTNGLGLEEFLEDMLISAGGNATIVPLAERIEADANHDHQTTAPATDHGHDGQDPHVWFDVLNVVAWVEVVSHELAAQDAPNEPAYTQRATAYIADLQSLDQWIFDQLESLPLDQRILVTNHDSFAYFAAAYQFEVVGAVIAAYSTVAEPSAQEIAALQGIVAQHNVQAIFVEVGVNPALAQQVATDTGIGVVELYTGALSPASGPANSYIEMMRYNVSVILTALSK